ncbi:hypothetical protein [Maribacter sp. R77961]|uniref:hypothetical protein n=1 Tax=Maribacter sp. R77961 TaxID=3093871 RepID=UPI0037CC9232
MKYYILSLFVLSALEIEPKAYEYDPVEQETIQKGKAFEVLQTKCNVCHATKKRVDIFTFENMDSLAYEINKQVFIKKKMPKGKKIKLTSTEKNDLTLWIEQTKNKA